MTTPTRGKDAASILSLALKGALRQVSFGAKVGEGGSSKPGSKDYQKNPKGGITKEVGALVYALTDLDSWYSILMSSLVAFILNRNNYFLKPQGSGFFREFLTFTLYELLQPKLSSVIPRFGVQDIDTHRYRAGPYGSIEANPRLAYAAQGDWGYLGLGTNFQGVGKRAPSDFSVWLLLMLAWGKGLTCARSSITCL